MMNPPPRFDFPASWFPITLEAMNPDTRAVVWRKTIERPDDFAVVYIPPLKLIHGHPIAMVLRSADGREREGSPR